MADISLSRGGSKTLTINGKSDYAGSNQKITFTFSYSNSGVLSVNMQVNANGWGFKSTDCLAYIEISGTRTTIQNHTTLRAGTEGYASVQNLGTASKTITYSGDISVFIHFESYANGYGPTPRSGSEWTYYVNVPGTYSTCSAPTTLKINNSTAKPQMVEPGESVTVSWSGASGGLNNPISGYLVEWGQNSLPWSSAQRKTVTSTSTSVTIPSKEGEYIDFRVTTQGSVSGYVTGGSITVNQFARTYSKPTMKTATVSQSNGDITISWQAGSAGISNSISSYNIYYQSKQSSSSSWGNKTLLVTKATSDRSHLWEEGTPNRYYRFTVNAKGTNYSESTDNWTSQILLLDSYTAATAPTSFTYTIQGLETGQTNPYPSQSIQLTWSGATGGTKNEEDINPLGYEIQYQSNNGSWYNLDSSINATESTKDYTITQGTSILNFRIRTKSQGGTSWYSPYVTLASPITVGVAPAPSSETAEIRITQQMESDGVTPINQLNFEVTSPFTINSIYNKIISYDIYYTSARDSNVSDNINSYTLWKNISTIEDIPVGGEPFANAEWGLYYRFAMIAYGEYNGQSTPVFSNTAEIVAPQGIPAQRVIISGSGAYTDESQEVKAIGGNQKFIITPDGYNDIKKLEIEYSTDGTYATSTKADIPLGGSFTLNTGDFDSGVFYYIRIWSYALGEDTPIETPLYINEDIHPNGQVDYVSRDYLSTKNKENPIVQIKRAYDYVWEREDSRSNGLRLADGELGATYTPGIPTPKLKLGDGKTAFKDLPYLFVIPENITEISEIYTPAGIFPKSSNFEINAPTVNFFESNSEMTRQMSIKYNPDEEALEFLSI